MPDKHPILGSDCNGKVNLLTHMKAAALASSLVGVPAVTVLNYKQISNLACMLVINISSQAITTIAQELGPICTAVL